MSTGFFYICLFLFVVISMTPPFFCPLCPGHDGCTYVTSPMDCLSHIRSVLLWLPYTSYPGVAVGLSLFCCTGGAPDGSSWLFLSFCFHPFFFLAPCRFFPFMVPPVRRWETSRSFLLFGVVDPVLRCWPPYCAGLAVMFLSSSFFPLNFGSGRVIRV